MLPVMEELWSLRAVGPSSVLACCGEPHLYRSDIAEEQGIGASAGLFRGF